MSARLSRGELAVLIEELLTTIDEDWDIKDMTPHDAYNLGCVRQGIKEIEHGLLG